MNNLDSTYLREVLEYDQNTGIFTWKFGNKRNTKANQIAGSIHPEGYRYICLKSKNYRAHRLAWLYIFDEMPKHQIDHINGIKDDNRIVNLRQVTHAENQQNKHSTKGYSWHQKRQSWEAYIRINGKKSTLGYFEKEEDAQLARIKAKHEHHPFFTSSR
jgi:hypothetical protein